MPVHLHDRRGHGLLRCHASGRQDPGQPVPPAEGTQRAAGLPAGLDLVKGCDPR